MLKHGEGVRSRFQLRYLTLASSVAVLVGVALAAAPPSWRDAAPASGPERAASGSASSPSTGAQGDAPGDDQPSGSAASAARLAAAAAPMPTGNLAGWRQTFTEDFTTPLAAGGWGTSSYRRRWLAYDGFPDTHAVGRYDAAQTLSASGGDLDMTWSTQAGVPRVSGLVPLVNGAWGGQQYGRYSVRYRADPVAGYAGVLLLWPDSNKWDQGEVDFAEGSLNGVVNAYHHCPGVDPTSNCGLVNTTAVWNDWHVSTVEWTPSGVTYYLDGVKLMTASAQPTGPLHLVLQGFARAGVSPAATARVQVDWVSIWAYDPSAH